MNETPKNYVPILAALTVAVLIAIGGIAMWLTTAPATEEPALKVGDVRFETAVKIDQNVEIDYKIFPLSSDCYMLKRKNILPEHMIELCNKAHKKADEYHIILDKRRVPELEIELKRRFK